MSKFFKINFLICLVITIFLVSDVQAATVEFKYCSGVTLTSKYIDTASASGATFFGDQTEAIYLSNNDTRILYCLEKGKPLSLESSGKPTASYIEQDATSGKYLWISRVIAYGYYTLQDGHSIDSCPSQRIATQLLVQLISKQGANGAWRTYTKNDFLSFMTSDSSKRESVANYMVSIRDKALEADTKPSFDGKTVTLKYNPSTYKWTGSITDSNGVLSNWTKSDSGNVTSTISGNTVTLTASNDTSKSGKVTFTRTVPNGILYYSNYTSTFQKTAYYVSGNAKTITASLNYTLNDIGKGTVKIHKIDKYTSKNMQNAKFGIFSDNKCSIKAKDYLGNTLPEKTTDKNGFVSWDNLYYPLEAEGKKTYYVKETEVIPGYSIDNAQMEALGAGENNCVPVTLEAEKISSDQSTTTEYDKADVEVQAIYNIPYGNVTILKQDADTGAAIEGVEFKLLKYNKDKDPATDIYGNEVKNVVTGKNGIAEFENLPYGDYILEEVKTTSSYKVLEEPIEFTLNADTDALKFKSQGTDALPIIGEDKGFTYYLGDATGDNKIDQQDKEILEKILAKNDEDITDKQRYALDVNKDDKLNSADLNLMESYIGGNKEVFKGLEKIEVEGEVLVPYETYRLGDPTEDGIIDSNDLTIIVGILEGTIKEEDITKAYKYASDLDLDGQITEKDKDLMTSYLGGNPDSFEALKEIEYPDQFQKRVTIVVTNVPIDMKVSKQAITNEKELKGATITIKNSKGEVFLTYKSTGKPHEFYIPVGDYTLIEQIAPQGYQNLKTEVEFRVGTDGNIKLLSAKSNMYKLIKSQEEDDNDLDHLIIYNNLKKVVVPNTGSTIAIISIIGGLALIGGGSYLIYKRYKLN